VSETVRSMSFLWLQTPCIIFSSGALHCWGYGPGGRLGDGTTTSRETPKAVTGLNSRVSMVVCSVVRSSHWQKFGSCELALPVVSICDQAVQRQ